MFSLQVVPGMTPTSQGVDAVGRCPTVNAARLRRMLPLGEHHKFRRALPYAECHKAVGLGWDEPALFVVHCSLSIERVIYTTLTHVYIRICNYHLFLVTLLMQSNKRSVFPHNVHPPAFIVRTPNPLKGALPFA